MALLFTVCIGFFIESVEVYNNKINGTKKYFLPGKKFIIIVWIIIFTCWIPALIASFPGVFSYDAPYQYWQFTTGTFINNQPIVSSAILYLVMNIGNFIFRSYEGGLAFFIILQMLFGSFVLAYSCNFLNKLKLSYIFQILIIVFFAVFPVNHLMVVNATKDTLYAFIFIFLIISILELVQDIDHFTHSPLLITRFIILILLQMLYRNNGVYVFILLIPILLIAIRDTRKNIFKIFFICMSCLIFYFSLTGPIYNALGIEKSKFVEMLAIPTQQIASAYAYNSDELTKEEIDTLSEIMPPGSPEDYQNLYHPRNSDYIRTKVNGDKIKEDLFKYIKNYITIGIKSPKIHLNAFLNLTLGYWYPNMVLPNKDVEPQKYIEYTNSEYSQISVMTERYNILPGLSDFYRSIGEEGSYSDIPILSMLFSIGFVSWMLLLILVTFIYYKRYYECIPILIAFLLWLTSVAGPVVLLRYVYSLFLLLPISFGMLYAKNFNKKTNEDSNKEHKNLKMISK